MTLAVRYDPVADAAFIEIADGEVVDTVVATDRVNLDFGSRGELLGIEVLEVSRTAPHLMLSGVLGIAAE
jgi:uncharacterized protein YuzE